MNRYILFFIFIVILFTGCKTIGEVKQDRNNSPEIDNQIIKPEQKEKVSHNLDKDMGNIIETTVNIKEKNNNSKMNITKNSNKKYTNSQNYKTNNKKKNEYKTVNKNENNDKYSQSVENMKIEENPLKEIDIEENQKFYISLKDPGWILKKIDSKILKLINRENKENNTLFQFETTVSGTVNMIFTRYLSYNNTLQRQPYRVNITSDPLFIIDENETIEEEKYENVFYNDEMEMQESDTEIEEEKENQTEEDIDLRKQIANEYFNQNNYEEAKKIYLDLINQNKGDPEIYYNLGIIEKNKSDLDRANEYFRFVLNGEENNFYNRALVELLKNLKKQKKFIEAIDAFHKYSFSNEIDSPSAEELNILLADLYFKMKDYNNAGSEYRRFIKRFPFSNYFDKALFYLAYSMESKSINPDFREASRLYMKLVDEFPESKYYNLSKKRILFLDRHYLKIN